MAKMKDAMLCELDLLARMSGYGVEELLAIYFQHEDDCQDLGEPVNWRSFIGVTMERDW